MGLSSGGARVAVGSVERALLIHQLLDLQAPGSGISLLPQRRSSSTITSPPVMTVVFLIGHFTATAGLASHLLGAHGKAGFFLRGPRVARLHLCEPGQAVVNS